MAYQSSTPGGILLGSRIEIIGSAPLAELNTIAGQAFAARAKNEASTDMVAIVCNAGLQPRTDMLAGMRNVDHPSMLRLIESGVVHWPNDQHYYTFAYAMPASPRMMNSLDEPIQALGEDALNTSFITPIVGALAEFERTGVIHHAIRPTNIFWRIGGSAAPQLGDCLSSPPGVGQPVLFETLERGLSMPNGRGNGSHTDDCYAFGVTLVFMILGQNPLAGMDDAAILQMKNERGTFNALIGNRRLSPGQTELLRGLLTDDAKQRWTATDIDQWLSGRRLTPKNTDAGRRATRHIEFAGKEYWQMRPLASALAVNVGAAAQLVESGALDKWLHRAMADADRVSDLEDAKNSVKDIGKNVSYEEQLVSRICIALDRVGPIRYRGLSVMPHGIANLLTDAILTGTNISALSEIIATQLVTFWVEMQKEVKTELVPLAQQFERMRGVIEKAGFGFGIERVLYELNQSLPCLSPIVRSHYVNSPKSLLSALERVAVSGNRPPEPIDRHIAAFLVVRDRRSENLFEPMSLTDGSPRKGLALLKLYGEMQQRYGPDSLPNLAQWLLPMVEASIQRFLGKGLKEKLQIQVREVAQRGDLIALLRLVDDNRRVEQDRQEFTAARMLYLSTLKEIAHIENKLANRDIVLRTTGKPMAASLSSFVAILFVMVAVCRAIWQSITL
ncbi:MAG: serine/threonine protein kinase [Alphaproteobacteria bacterium]